MDFHDPHFWTLVAFVLLIAAIWRPVSTGVRSGLDGYCTTVAGELERSAEKRAAASLHEAELRHRHSEIQEQAQQIVTRAQTQAENYEREARESLEQALIRRRKRAQEYITRLEEQACAEISQETARLCFQICRLYLSGYYDHHEVEPQTLRAFQRAQTQVRNLVASPAPRADNRP